MPSYTHKVANGNHIVTTDSVTSIHLTYRLTKSVSVEAVGYEQLAQSRYAVLRSHALTAMDRTRDLLMTSPIRPTIAPPRQLDLDAATRLNREPWGKERRGVKELDDGL